MAYGHQTFNSWKRYLGIEPLSHLNAAYGDGDSPVPGKHGEQAVELQAVPVERVVVAHRHHGQTSLLPPVSLKHKVLNYTEYHSVCPLVGIWTPPTPLPQAIVAPPEPKGGGGAHSPAGGVWGSPNSDD